jgi:phosphate-selective porin OprO/OprP
VTAGADGFALKSADGNFVLRLRGYAQADGRFYLYDNARNGTDTFLMRRVRPILEGTVYRDFDFRIMPDFGNGAASTTLLQDAYVEWHYWPWLKVRAGKYKVPVGLEWLQQDIWTEFSERGLPTGLVPQRDVGFQLSGDLFGGVVSYAVGAFNGVVDGGIADLDTSDSKDGAARIFIQPFMKTDIGPLKGFGFGAGGSISDEQPSGTTTNLASYKTTGQNTFFSFSKGVAPDGLEYRLSPQGYYYWGPLGVLAEYVMAEQELKNGAYRHYMRNSAWQTEASFVLTGEDASYNGVIPRHPFNLKSGGWGALEIVARYGDLHLDPDAFNTATGARFASPITSAQEAREWGVGLNWYVNRTVRLVLDYDQTAFDGGTGATAGTGYNVKSRETEHALFTRAQIMF